MKTREAISEFLQSRYNLKPVTIAWYRVRLERFATLYTQLPKGPGPIEAFLSQVTGSPETKHASYRTLKAFYRFISKRHRLANPIEQIEPPRRPRKVMATLEPNETMMLLRSVSNNSPSKLRDQAILTLFVDTGIRSSELADLRKQHINGETIKISGKTGEREVPISEETRRLLLSLIIAEDSADDYVFHGHKGPLTRSGVYKIVSAHMIKAGIQGPKVGAHRIRHAFGKGYLVNGGDLRSLQELMGHTNITTTEKYASLNLSDVISKHHRFTPLRAAHAAAQESFFDKEQVIKEAEAILTKKEDEA